MLNQNAVRDPLPFGKPSKPLDLAGFVKRYGLIVLVIGSFLFTVTVPVLLLISKPNYEVHALMRIDPVIPSLITKSEDPSIINYYQDYARTQARRMMDFEILRKTVEKLTPDQKGAIVPEGLPSDKCAPIIGTIIKVNPVPGTHLIDISASSPKKEGIAPLVNNFMEVFLEKVRRNAEMQDNERLVYLRNKKQSLSTEIATIEEKLNILTKDINTASFSENFNLASKQTEELQKLYVRTLGERVAAENQYQEVMTSNNQLKALSLNPMVDEVVMNDQSLDFTSSWTYQQLQQMRSSTDGLTKNNPDRIYVEQRMAAMKSYEKKLQNEVRNNAHKILYGKRDYDLQKGLILAKSNFDKTVSSEKAIQDSLKKNQEEGIRISLGLHLGESLEALLKHKRELLDRIDTRIHELEVEGKAPLRISVESIAREPDHPTGSNIQKLLLIFLAVSFGSVGGGFLAYDFFDNRIRRPEEIQQALGYPPTWPIAKSSGKHPFHKLLSLAPNDPSAKAVRSLAVRLNREKNECNAQIMLFSGIERGTGCSSIALCTAQALAGISQKVLLIEADIEHPAMGEMTGMPEKKTGFCDYLRGSTPLSAYLVPNQEHRIDIMYAGNPEDSEPPRRRIPELLLQAKNEYDFICIDTPPVLQSDLTEHLALYCDIIALIILGDSTLYRDLKRSAETVIRLKVPAIAPVLNWGGNKRSLSIDKLLEKQPEFLDKINTRKIEEFLQNLPAVRELMDRIRTTSGRFRKKQQEKS
jgi:Mrp family chromosome partitioning ATPase/uncharacterized protein involved in exopolysaccharide biosynthesis